VKPRVEITQTLRQPKRYSHTINLSLASEQKYEFANKIITKIIKFLAEGGGGTHKIIISLAKAIARVERVEHVPVEIERVK